MIINVAQKEDIEQLAIRLDKFNSLLNKVITERNKKEWISNLEFCKMLSISKGTAQKYRESKLIGYSQVGSKIFYKSSDIDAFLLKHHIKSEMQ